VYDSGERVIAGTPTIGQSLKSDLFEPVIAGIVPPGGQVLAGATPICTLALHTYWVRPDFHPEIPNEVSTEVGIMDSHFDGDYVAPYLWSNNVLENIVPFTP